MSYILFAKFSSNSHFLFILSFIVAPLFSVKRSLFFLFNMFKKILVTEWTLFWTSDLTKTDLHRLSFEKLKRKSYDILFLLILNFYSYFLLQTAASILFIFKHNCKIQTQLNYGVPCGTLIYRATIKHILFSKNVAHRLVSSSGKLFYP